MIGQTQTGQTSWTGRHVRWIIYFKRYAYHRKAVEASVEDGCYQGLGK